MTGTDSKELARFRELIDIHGASLRHWPDDARGWAEGFATTEPDARAILAEAEALDRRLSAIAAPSPSAALVGRIMAAAPAGENGWRLPGWFVPRVAASGRDGGGADVRPRGRHHDPA